MRVSRRTVMISAALAAMVGLAQAPAFAQSGGPVSKILVGFPPGSSIDLAARAFAAYARDHSDLNFIVENKPGAAGRIAMNLIKDAAPDGRSFALVPSPSLTLYPHTFRKLSYDVEKDFTYVGTLSTLTHGLAIGPAVPAEVKSLTDFISWAKGQKSDIFFSANAQGAGPHFLGLKFAKTIGVDFSYVPYQAGNFAATALIAGDIPSVVMGMADLTRLSEDGRMRILANSGEQRSKFAPNVPTFTELGYPELKLTESLILIGPKGLDEKIVNEFEKRLKEATLDQKVIDALAVSAFLPAYLDGTQTKAWVLEHLKTYKPEVEASGVSFDG